MIIIVKHISRFATITQFNNKLERCYTKILIYKTF